MRLKEDVYIIEDLNKGYTFPVKGFVQQGRIACKHITNL